MKSVVIALALVLGLQAADAKEKTENIPLKVMDSGFEPSEIKVKPGSHVVLKVTRTSDATCATALKVKEKNLNKELPLNQEVSIDLGTLKKGQIKFACGMDMISGHVVAE